MAAPSLPHYALITCYDAPPPPSGNRGPFIDSSYACWHLREGQVALEWEEGGFTAKAGDWVLCDPVLRRRQRFSADARIVSLRFQIHWDGEEGFRVPGLPLRFKASKAPALLPAAEAVLRDAGDGPAAHARRQAAFLHFIACWHEALEALGHAPSARAAGDPRLARALEMLAQHEGLGVIPYAELSKVSGLSRAQLDRLFGAQVGMSPRKFVERNCLRASERLLLEGRLSVKEISAELGFVDSSHFAKWFSRMTGMSPRDYRKVATQP